MRKREREDPCGICGHYHKYKEGEVCGICGHQALQSSETPAVHINSFPKAKKIFPGFLFVGSCDKASRPKLLKTQGISRVLNLDNMALRKREGDGEDPCGVCGHYHKYEEREVCGICGHQAPQSSETPSVHINGFPTEILPDFLYVGSYDDASRPELLKTRGIFRVLNTVPGCQNLYKSSFIYHSLQDDQALPFDDAIQFLEQCERDKARVLVHCMSGKSRSPAILIAYLMKCKGWKLAQSHQWVKERRPSVDITPAIYQQLQDYEQMIFCSIVGGNSFAPVFPSAGLPSFSFGIPKVDDSIPVPVFSSSGSSVARSPVDISLQEFPFGAGQTQNNVSGIPINTNLNSNSSDIALDSS